MMQLCAVRGEHALLLFRIIGGLHKAWRQTHRRKGKALILRGSSRHLYCHYRHPPQWWPHQHPAFTVWHFLYRETHGRKRDTRPLWPPLPSYNTKMPLGVDWRQSAFWRVTQNSPNVFRKLLTGREQTPAAVWLLACVQRWVTLRQQWVRFRLFKPNQGCRTAPAVPQPGFRRGGRHLAFILFSFQIQMYSTFFFYCQ